MLQLLPRGAYQHVAHEQSMVSPGADHPNTDPVALIPSRIPIDDVDPISSIQVIDGALPIDLPDLQAARISASVGST